VNRLEFHCWARLQNLKSARGLAQSKTLRAVCRSSANASRLGLRRSSGAVLVALVCLVSSGRAAASDDFFAQGVAACRAGQYPEAAAAFASAAQRQPASGTLDNLGIAEWQRGHAGAAILAWERARWIDPFDSRAKANLHFARQVTQLDEPQLKWFEAASVWLPPAAWVWLAGAGLWLAAGALILPGVFRRRKSGWHQMLAALGFCVFLFSLTANLGVVSRAQIGFVVKKDAPLLLTPTRDGEVISTLTDGEPARTLRTRGNYFLIRTGYATGWIDRSQFALVCANDN
jgi:tetratricopeptide (TPR) repeat protein